MSMIIKGGGVVINTSMAGNIQQVIPTFTPPDLGSKLTLWLDERDQVVETIAGRQQITFWGDQQTSTGPHDFGLYNGWSGPIPDQTINGYAAPDFFEPPIGYAASYMATSGSWNMSDLVSVSGYHVFAIATVHGVRPYQNSSIGSQNQGICEPDNWGGWWPLAWKYNGGSPQMTVGHYTYQHRSLVVTGSNLSLNTPVLLETWFDGSYIRCSVGSAAPESLDAGNINSEILNNHGLLIGYPGSFSGSLGSLLICNQALNETDRASVRQYLGTKYGVAY